MLLTVCQESWYTELCLTSYFGPAKSGCIKQLAILTSFLYFLNILNWLQRLTAFRESTISRSGNPLFQLAPCITLTIFALAPLFAGSFAILKCQTRALAT